MALEHDLEQFNDAGINVGASTYSLNETLLDEALAPFDITGRNDALYMSKLYSVFFCFENLLRKYIKDTLRENVKGDWTTNIPKKVLKKMVDRRTLAQKGNWLVTAVGEEIDYADFGDLKDIIISNWDYFADVVPSQHWLNQRMDELEAARNFTAHHRIIPNAEAARIYMYIRDWTNVLGL